MKRVLLVMLAATAALAEEEAEPAPAGATPEAKAPAEAGAPAVEARVNAAAGGFNGWNVRRQAGGLAEVGGALDVSLERGALTLDVPLRASHRQSIGTSLTESKGSAAVEGQWRTGWRHLRLSAALGVLGVWRPNWPDLYQPLGNGDYAPTSRYSHVDGIVTLQAAAKPLAHQHGRLKYRFTHSTSPQDPAFDAFVRPMHLTPMDADVNELDASWRYLGKGWAASARVDTFLRFDRWLFSRDAGTGLTHANPGGPPPNPLQTFAGAEPSLELEGELLDGKLKLGVRYGYEVVRDLFDGYYSFDGHHPRLQVRWRAPLDVELSLQLEAWLRGYGPNGYAAGGNHPPLAWGDHRVDNRVAATLEGRYPLKPQLALTAKFRVVNRATNFPDYVPYTYPATAGYDIKWSYTNVLATAGAEYRF